MEFNKDKNIITILQVLENAHTPLSGTKIAEKLQSQGFNLKPRTIRYYLTQMDKAGLTKNVSNHSGRIITQLGKKELHDAFITEKIGLIISKIEALSYSMSFSLATLSGTVVLNISTINIRDFPKAKECITSVFRKSLGMGNFLVYGRPDSHIGDFYVPSDKIAIGTICNVTINGIFLNEGIPVYPKFGGLLEIIDGKPVGFKEIIEYSSTTIDPLEIFIKGKMTSVSEVVKTGNGIIGASFREIPEIAIPKAIGLKRKLLHAGFGGILLIGNSIKPFSNLPIPVGRTTMMVTSGLNPMAACQEEGIETHNMAMKKLYDFKHLSPFDLINSIDYLD